MFKTYGLCETAAGRERRLKTGVLTPLLTPTPTTEANKPHFSHRTHKGGKLSGGKFFFLMCNLWCAKLIRRIIRTNLIEEFSIQSNILLTDINNMCACNFILKIVINIILRLLKSNIFVTSRKTMKKNFCTFHRATWAMEQVISWRKDFFK